MAIATIAMTAAAGPARASYCTVKPTAVIVHTNQNLYFTAETVCSDWCLIPPGWSAEQKDRAMSLLTTAIAQDRRLTFFFPNGCGKQAIYAEPDLIAYGR